MMFSISTMASSTRMPTTRLMDSSVTTLSVKPKTKCITAKAGMMDSGSAVAATSVARQSRRKNHTTTTARMAPSSSRYMLPSKFSTVGSTKLKASVMTMSGCSARRVWSLARTPSATSVSPAPRLRWISKATAGLPLISAPLRTSATVSVTVAIWSRRTRRPSGMASCRRANCSALCTVAMVRTLCSMPPTSARPPGASVCTARNWRLTSAALMPRASSLAGSSSTRTSRATPPTRLTAPTPRTASMDFLTSLSTNQDSASSSIRLEATV